MARAAAVAVIVGLAVAGCGGGSEPRSSSPTAPTTSAAASSSSSTAPSPTSSAADRAWRWSAPGPRVRLSSWWPGSAPAARPSTLWQQTWRRGTGCARTTAPAGRQSATRPGRPGSVAGQCVRRARESACRARRVAALRAARRGPTGAGRPVVHRSSWRPGRPSALRLPDRGAVRRPRLADDPVGGRWSAGRHQTDGQGPAEDRLRRSPSGRPDRRRAVRSHREALGGIPRPAHRLVHRCGARGCLGRAPCDPREQRGDRRRCRRHGGLRSC